MNENQTSQQPPAPITLPCRVGDRVWVRILAKPGSNSEDYAPGVITDPTVATRPILQSAEKIARNPGGIARTIQRSVMVASYRIVPPTPDRPEERRFYAERAENVVGLFPRARYESIVDGPVDGPVANLDDHINKLRAAAQESLNNLRPASSDLMDKAASKYEDAGVLV